MTCPACFRTDHTDHLEWLAMQDKQIVSEAGKQQVAIEKRRRPVRIVTMSRLTQAQRTDLIQIGQKMGNVFFNMDQSREVPERWRKLGKDLQIEWDEVKNAKS